MSSSGKYKIVALVLAAGKSTRMGAQNKLLLKFNDQSMVSHVVDQLIQSDVSSILVVTGNEADHVRNSITQDVKFADNPYYELGLSSSLKVGISELPAQCDGVMICLGDMPYITSEDYNSIIMSFKPNKIIAPTLNGKIGNPLIFSKEYFLSFAELEGDKGARKFLKEHKENVVKVDLNTEAIFDDIDTPLSYEQILGKI